MSIECRLSALERAVSDLEGTLAQFIENHERSAQRHYSQNEREFNAMGNFVSSVAGDVANLRKEVFGEVPCESCPE